MTTTISAASRKTIEGLTKKADDWSSRMPSIKSIHALLTELGVKHYYDGEVTNVVESRSAGRRYVNDRHDGKVGKLIRVGQLEMNSSDSYYSWNTADYASRLLEIINHSM